MLIIVFALASLCFSLSICLFKLIDLFEFQHRGLLNFVCGWLLISGLLLLFCRFFSFSYFEC